MDPLSKYPVLVVEGQHALGLAKGLSGKWPVKEYPVMKMRTALTMRHETDAHLMLYLLTKRDTGEFLTSAPRFTKHASEWPLQSRLLNSKGLEVKVYWLCIDLDTPGHKALSDLPDGGKAWLQSKKFVLDSLAKADKYHFARYTTHGGARALAPLSHPLTPEEFEIFSADVIVDLNQAGLGVDNIKHWTGLFRLPKVKRELKSKEVILLDGKLGLDDVKPIDTSAYVGRKGKQSANSISTDTELPPLSDLPEGVDPFSLVEWRGAEDLRDKLKAGKAIGSDGNRYLETRGAIASVSQRMDEPRADVILKVFEASLRTMSREGSVTTVSEMPSWAQKVAEGDRKAKARLRAETDEILEMLAGRSGTDSTDKALAEVEKGVALAADQTDLVTRLLLATNREYYVWSELRSEYVGPFSRSTVRLNMERESPNLSMTDVSLTRQLKVKEDTVLYGSAGGLRDVDAILQICGQYIKRFEYVAGLEKSEYDPETHTLLVGAAPLRSLPPERSPQVEHWLSLISGSMTDKFLDWLATFRRLTRPTCAVYLEGVPGAGKELLATGIAQLFQSGIYVRYEHVSSDFNDLLKQSALVYADEKMPDQGMRKGAPSAVFRTLTSTDQHEINSKGRDKAILKMCPRILITANDARALNLVSESLEADSVDAIAQRILHLCPDDRLSKARDYLQEIGGRDTTEAWVGGCAIARHILWLEETRAVKPGTRFLVEGAGPNVRRLIVGREQDRILEALCRYLNRYNEAAFLGESVKHPAIMPTNGGLFVNASALSERWSTLMSHERTVSVTDAGRMLANLSGKPRETKRISGAIVNGYTIGMDQILEACEVFGVGDPASMRRLMSVVAA